MVKLIESPTPRKHLKQQIIDSLDVSENIMIVNNTDDDSLIKKQETNQNNTQIANSGNKPQVLDKHVLGALQKNQFQDQIYKLMHEFIIDQEHLIRQIYLSGNLSCFSQDLYNLAIENNFPLIVNEISQQLQMEEEEWSLDIQDRQKHSCFIEGCKYISGWFLYNYLPCNTYQNQYQNLQQQQMIKVYWLLMIFKIAPIYGISIIYQSWMFFLIDKKDEYQMVHYTLNFKLIQFFSLGIINMAIEFYLQFNCQLSQNHTQCFQSRFQYQAPYQFSIIMNLLLLLLPWISFLEIQKSIRKGYDTPKIKYPLQKSKMLNKKPTLLNFNNLKKDQKQQSNYCIDISKNRRILLLLVWDLIWAIGATILCLILFYNNNEDWKQKSIFKTSQVCYGLSSFPFVMFIIPSIIYSFSSSNPTGYNRYGDCLPNICFRRKMMHPNLLEIKRTLRQKYEQKISNIV